MTSSEANLKLSSSERFIQLPVGKENCVIIRSNGICGLCHEFTTSALTTMRCMNCSFICHIWCFQKAFPESNSFQQQEWICFHCENTIQEKKFQEKRTLEKYANELFHNSQIKIATKWRCYIARKKYLKLFSAIVQMQIAFLVRLRRKRFMRSVQNKLRTVRVKIRNFTNLHLYDPDIELQTTPFSSPVKQQEQNPESRQSMNLKNKKEYSLYFIVSVFDSEGDHLERYGRPISHQTWRLDSQFLPIYSLTNCCIDVPIDEKLLLGGVSGFQTIVITLFQKNNIHNGRDIFLGQSSFDLSKNNLWKSGGRFIEIPLEDYQYEVIEPSSNRGIQIDTNFFGSLSMNSVITSSTAVTKNDTERHTNNGFITLDIMTTNTMNASCCLCLSNSLEEYIKEVRKLTDQTGFNFPPPPITQHNYKKRNSNFTSSFVAKMKRLPGSSANNSPGYAEEDNYDRISEAVSPSVATSFFPSLANSSTIPSYRSPNVKNNSPLSIHSTTSPTNNNGYGMKKLWISVYDGKLFLFNHFGEPLRLILDLQYFQVSFSFSNNESDGNSPSKAEFYECKRDSSVNKKNENENENNIIYILTRRNSTLEFRFCPANENDTFQMKCAFFTSLRLAKGFMTIPGLPVSSFNNSNNSSKTTTSSNAHPEKVTDNFDINALLQDLVSLEEMKNRQLAAFMEAPRPPTVSNNPLAKLPALLKLPSSISRSFSTTTFDSNDTEDDLSQNPVNYMPTKAKGHPTPKKLSFAAQSPPSSSQDSVPSYSAASIPSNSVGVSTLPPLRGSSIFSSSGESTAQRMLKAFSSSSSSTTVASASTTTASPNKQRQSLSPVITSEDNKRVPSSLLPHPSTLVPDLTPSLSLSSLQFTFSDENELYNDRSIDNEHNLDFPMDSIPLNYGSNSRMKLFTRSFNDSDEDENSFSVDSQESIRVKPKIKRGKPLSSLPKNSPSKKGIAHLSDRANILNSPSVVSLGSGISSVSSTNSGKQPSPNQNQIQNHKEALQQRLMDQVFADEMLANEKYQLYGENFIQTVLNRTADRQIHQDHYQPRENLHDLSVSGKKYSL